MREALREKYNKSVIEFQHRSTYIYIYLQFQNEKSFNCISSLMTI